MPVKIESDVAMRGIFIQQWPLWVVYGAAMLVISYFTRRMRKKGIEPFPTLTKAKKYEKKIDRFTNIFAVGMVILTAIMAVGMIYPLLDEYRNPLVPLDEKNCKLLTGIICMLSAFNLGFIVFFTGMTPFFQRNLTNIKRLVLLAISILPLSFFAAWFFTGDDTFPSTKLKMIIGYAVSIGIINGPGIVSGTSFFELYEIILTKFSHKIQ